jgi:nucleotide-binding universal stress UspA family protein
MVVAMTSADETLPFRKVVVGYDGSRQSQKALGRARDLARTIGAKLLIVGVGQLPASDGLTSLQKAVEDARERYGEVFYRLRLQGMNEGQQVDTLLSLGYGLDGFLRTAERLHADLIVIGPDLDDFREPSNRLLCQAPCTVMVVK